MKNVKILYGYTCFLTLIFACYIHTRPSYAVLLVIESSERTHQDEYIDLAGMALKNIADLLHDYQNRTIPVYIEWHNCRHYSMAFISPSMPNVYQLYYREREDRLFL